MSGSGGGGGGRSPPKTSCADLVIYTQLSSPKADVIDKVKVGDVLDVENRKEGATVYPAVLYKNKVAGGVASPDAKTLRECLEKGQKYKAKVTSKSGGQVGVLIEAT
jgi:hypothetical protein